MLVSDDDLRYDGVVLGRGVRPAHVGLR